MNVEAKVCNNRPGRTSQPTFHFSSLKSLPSGIQAAQTIPKSPVGDQPIGHPFSLSPTVSAPSLIFPTC